MAGDDLGDWKHLYLGPGRNGALLEIVTLARGLGSEVAIHAMKMRPKYKQILSGGG